MKSIFAKLAIGCTLLTFSSVKAADKLDLPAHNIVHIIIDDLRTELGAYGISSAVTPNIDKLAREGVTFDRAYCQQSVCGPSRNSFMTGRRPDRSRSWNCK